MLYDPKACDCRTEYKTFQNIKEALRVTVEWRVPSVGISRKLSSVLFIIRALQRHLERLLDLEERDGYMEVVGERNPNRMHDADRLLSDHEEFRQSLREILPTVEERPSDED